MADAIVMEDTNVPIPEEIQTMKVTDLRKKLKEFGLPTTGNKTELIERLQEAYLANKGDSFDGSQFGFDDSQISELDSVDDGSAAIEDSALFEQDQVLLSVSSSLEDDPKVLDNTESKLRSNMSTVPPKKRALPKNDCDGLLVQKKVTLNRTNTAYSDFNIKNETESKQKIISINSSESEEKRVLSVKNMSAAERLAMRAKRFNVSGTAVTNSNSKFTSNKNSKQSIMSSATAPDLNVLKKRAERFGQCVSTVMKQLEHKEKLLKRKCKFGANLSISATASLDEQEKKRQRADRFGIS